MAAQVVDGELLGQGAPLPCRRFSSSWARICHRSRRDGTSGACALLGSAPQHVTSLVGSCQSSTAPLSFVYLPQWGTWSILTCG